MITKEICRNYALKVKQETGKFPVQSDWVVKNGYPTSRATIGMLFEGYNNFRDYCGEPHKIRTQELTIDWLKANCTIDNNNCWNWNKHTHFTGYGQIKYKGKQCYTHIISYGLVKGQIPEELLVRHKCDNRKCCNPEHLELGTHSDNMLDAVLRNSKYISGGGTKNGRFLVNKTLQERIKFYLSNTNITESNCLISNILKPTSGDYYQIRFENRMYYLHRLILADKLNKHYDEIDIARHICNNSNCINPNHLVEGNRSENAVDSRKFVKNTKLTEEEVIEIRVALVTEKLDKYGDKTKFDQFWANKFKVSSQTIKYIRLGSSWKDVKINEIRS